MRSDERSVWMPWTDVVNALDLRPAIVLKLIEDQVLTSEETSGGLVMVRRTDVERLRELDPNEPRPAEPFVRLALRRRMEATSRNRARGRDATD